MSHSSLEKGVQTEGLHDTIGILLACIDQCALQTPLFRHLLHDTPLLEATSTHAEMLLAMEASVQTLREQLAVALEAVQAFARSLAAAQRRDMRADA